MPNQVIRPICSKMSSILLTTKPCCRTFAPVTSTQAQRAQSNIPRSDRLVMHAKKNKTREQEPEPVVTRSPQPEEPQDFWEVGYNVFLPLFLLHSMTKTYIYGFSCRANSLRSLERLLHSHYLCWWRWLWALDSLLLRHIIKTQQCSLKSQNPQKILQNYLSWNEPFNSLIFKV